MAEVKEAKAAPPPGPGSQKKEPIAELRWELQEILPNLFLGPTSPNKIKEYGIEAVLCARGELGVKVPETIPVLWLKGFLETSFLDEWMPRCVEFLNTHWKDGKKKTLICCATGVGRSPVITALYMCLYRKWDGEEGFNKAVDDISEKRVCAFGYPEINNHFFPQALTFLENYDMSSFTELAGSRAATMHVGGGESSSSSSSSAASSTEVEFCDDLACANPMPCQAHQLLVRVARGASGVRYSDGFVRVTGADTGIVKLEVGQGAFVTRRAAFDISPWPTPFLEGIQFNGTPQEDRSQYTVEFYGQGESSGARIVFGPESTARLSGGGELIFINQYR
jgi:hypothetical protein